jgi:hypothetical protein
LAEPKFNIYEIEDTATGQIYELEAPEGTTEDQLSAFIAAQNQAQSPEEQGVVPQAEQPQVAAPSGVQVGEGVAGQAPAMQERETETLAVQSVDAGANMEWMDPEAKATVDKMMQNRPRQEVVDYINAHAREKGKFEVGLGGTQEQYDAYQQSIAQGAAPVETGYEQTKLSDLGFNDAEVQEAPAEGEMGFFEQMGAAMSQSAQEGFGGVAGRNLFDLFDSYNGDVRKAFPDISDEQVEDLTDYVVAMSQKDLIAANEIRNKNSDWLPWLSGQLLGSGSPIDAFIPGGGKFISQMAKGAIGNAVEDVAVQGANVYQGVQDGYRPEQTVMAAGLGAGIGGLTGSVGTVATNRRVAREIAQERAMAKNPLGENAAIKEPSSRKGSKAYKAELTEAGDAIAAHVGELKKDWTNTPDIEILDDFTGIDADNNAIGVYREDGSVALNSAAILREAKKRNTTPEAIASAVTFHESLGHYGLAQKFGEDLDFMMERFYENGNLDFKQRVDEYRAKNPEDGLALSVEEVLAGMSEKGRMPVKYMDELKNKIKDFARRTGLKDFKYSTREIEAVLGMAHAAVINGKRVDVVSNNFGFKNMMTGTKGNMKVDADGYDQLPDGYYEAMVRATQGEDYGPSSQVRKDTGWFVGPDDKWRMEVDDSNANYNLDFSDAPEEGFSLAEVIDHPALFDMYPNLQKIRVVREAVPKDTKKRYQGWFDDETNTINITPYAENPKGTLLHEIQHWIQDKEGFSRGGNTESALRGMPDKKLETVAGKVAKYHLREARKNQIDGDAYLAAVKDPLFIEFGKATQLWRKEGNKDYRSPEALAAQDAKYKAQDALALKYLGSEKIRKAPEADQHQFYRLLLAAENDKGAKYGLEKEAKYAHDRAIRELKKSQTVTTAKGNPDQLRKVLNDNEHLPWQAYEHMFGEVEARDTSNRRTLSDRERKLSDPYSSETRKGIEPNDYIFTDGLGPQEGRSADMQSDLTREVRGLNNARAEKQRKALEANSNTLKRDRWAQKATEGERAGKYMMPNTTVVDADGNPKAVYHGTSKDAGFKNFKVGPRGSWFTEDPDIASSYSIENDSKRLVPDPNGQNPWSLKEKNNSARVASVYLNIENPKVLTSQDLSSEVMARGGESYARGEAAYFRELKAEGFDGVKVESHAGGPTTWVVLDKPSQIVSATNPKGGGKYMKPGRYDPLDAEDLTADELFESQNALGILQDLTANQERISLTDQEMRAEAELRGFTAQNFLKTQPKQAGDISRRLIMYDIAADKMNTKITKLYAKLQDGTADANTAGEYAKTLFRFEELATRMFGEQSEVGRALRTIQSLSYTKNKLEGMKQQLSGLDEKGLTEFLSDPANFDKFAREIQGQLAETKAKVEQSKVSKFAINALNLPRAIMSSMDLSAPLRQGIFFIGRKQFWTNIPKMFQYAMSEDLYKNLMLEIAQRPNYDLMVKNNLSFSSMDGKLKNREEDFMTEWADYIPGIRQSNRAYAGFLNKVRADVFDDLVDKFEKTGMDMDDGKMLKDLAGFINNATGRGDLGKYLRGAAPALNTMFFSPRLIASRVQMLNPIYYARLSPPVRSQAMLSAMSFGAIAMTVMSLLEFGGATVEGDPRSTDFGKVKFGDTRYDILGGFGQYITLGARMYSKSTVGQMGQEQELNNPKDFGGKTRGEVTGKFLTNKFAPVTSYLWAWYEGENAVGDPFVAQDEAFNRMLPMFLSDYNDMAEKYGPLEGTAKSIPGVFGVGFQDYKPFALDAEKEILAPDTFEDNDLEDGDYGDMTVADGKVTVAPEIAQEWQERLNGYIQGWMKEEMSDPAWEGLTDKEKADIIAGVRKESKERAREDIKEKLGV